MSWLRPGVKLVEDPDPTSRARSQAQPGTVTVPGSVLYLRYLYEDLQAEVGTTSQWTARDESNFT